MVQEGIGRTSPPCGARRVVRVASRRSALALAQTRWVIERFQTVCPDVQVEIVTVVTEGDRVLDQALSAIGGKGLFVSDIERALLEGRADFAVHSLKDVPAQLAPGLLLAATPPREDARDALLSRDRSGLAGLRPGAVVGTSSLRRAAQLRRLRPDLHIRPLRGNIDTRLRRLEAGEWDAIVLAASGLHRMGWHDRITAYLDPEVMVPAIGQGVLGIECRAADRWLREQLAALNDPATALASAAERALLLALNGGCQIPLGGHAVVFPDGTIRLRGMVASADGAVLIQSERSGRDPQAIGREVASDLIRQGADRLLAAGAAAEG